MKTSVIALISAFFVSVSYAHAEGPGGFRPYPRTEQQVKKNNFWDAFRRLDKNSKIVHFTKPKEITARITYYNAHEDKWGSRIACSTKMRAQEGVTVAAHPDFPFFKNIQIPLLKGIVGNGNFVVQDRGRAVTRKKASGGESYVFDVFLSGSRKRTAALAEKLPHYMKVLVN